MRLNSSGFILVLLTVKRFPASAKSRSEGVDATRMPNIFLDNWLKYSLTSFSAVDGLAKASNNLFFRCCTGGGETLDKLYRLTGYIRRIRLD